MIGAGKSAGADNGRGDDRLLASEARFRALMTAGSYAIYRMSPDWRLMYRLDGREFLADTEAPRADWTDGYILDEDLPVVMAAIARAIRDKAMFSLEHRVRRSDGDVGWTLSRAVPILDEAGEIVEWFGAASDVTDRRQAQEAQEALRRSEERLQLMVAELQHRTRNLLAVVGGIADQTRAMSDGLDDFGDRFDRRLAALRRVQGLLSAGPEPAIPLDVLVRTELSAHGIGPDANRVEVAGPAVALPPAAVQPLALALHELATNALKHGALRAAAGRLAITWVLGEEEAGGQRLRLDWTERGVPIPPGEPRRGFGRELIEVDLPFELDAATRLTFGPDGASCSIELALS